ncbi:twin-arginine translocation (Tat) [Bradyrhizobium sp.]|uniref:twin-arginine translocation (Tat) n=1 Tax=Bradyrhizobium sp. TaxID=376 RepID=UPI001DBF8F61|nr:twin-arginine translocation (Tat) [Bradyrhizobium sp.]MBI5318335.1 twin-arginine translocation (Tat) [Bradyrhizobium sp.]
MERREFLRIAAGLAAGVAAFAATAQAAPLMPQPLNEDAKLPQNPAQPAVTSKDETDQLQPEEVRWGRGRHRGWGRRWGYRRRHWGWRRRRWWGYRRRRWRRRYWRRRYW